MFEKFINLNKAEINENHQETVAGVTINFGRPKSEIDQKRLDGDIYEILKTKEISIRLTESGELKVIDGNTTLLNALKEMVDIDLINVVYTTHSKWAKEGEGEYLRTNLAELLERAREVQENLG
ncbi:MAG: hypothetical protein KBC78_02065 [Candidatus Pacebacteria bacterium]|jgi:hypothetical protein|nr:hypothetical protein [Candidatus Paceibacterota bacterium]